MSVCLRNLSRTGAALLLGAILGSTPLLVLAGGNTADPPLTRPQAYQHLGQSLETGGQRAAILNRNVEVFVHLSEPSVSRFVRNELDAGRAKPDKSEQIGRAHV